MRIISDAERRDRIGVRHALAVGVSTPEVAARAVTCLHATEPANVYLSAFARSGASRADISDALYARRSIVRQLAMRRTVFALPRELFPAIRASASARVAAQLTARLAKEVELAGISNDGRHWIAQLCDDTRAAIRETPATTAELRARVPGLNAQIGVPGVAGEQTSIASRLLTALAADGSVMRGTNAGGWKVSRPAWTATEQWLGREPEVLDERAGYRALVLAWLWSFGPGTEDDIVWWLGATKAAVRRALDDIGAIRVSLEGGAPAWLHPADEDPVSVDGDWAALLPALDPSTMGWRQREFYLGGHAERIFDRTGNGGPTAWWNGRIVGSWTQQPDATVTVIPIGPLPRRATKALQHKADALTSWLDGEIVRSVYQTPLVRSL